MLQQARRRGIRVIGTASAARFDEVRRFGGIPVSYGAALEDRVRAVTDAPIVVALDTVGTSDAVDASLELVEDLRRIVTVAAPARAAADGFRAIAGSQPESAAFRDSIRADLIALAGAGELEVPIAGIFPLAEAIAATRMLATGHAGGKFALIP
ncbi:zinc-binding dehydrogenase [uncultured Microbacterium sp.]|uniref:zinc-binding dehydrogenase n=1 Tax=uncultured Microbacterium sp. TaxID=191216 RepID=UPI002625E077|nr:zinc-binding dehydrogenase [uncultured Microbacterium sp.]